MKPINGFIRIAVISLALVIAGIFAGCNSAPLSTPPAPPPPAITSSAQSTPVPITTSMPSTTVETSSTPAQTSTPAAVAEITVTSNKVDIVFPDEITFSVTAKSPATIKIIYLKYGSDERSLVPEVSSSKADFNEGLEVSTSWTWKMKKTGSMPPGATIWWKWEISDASGNTFTTEKQSAVYTDTRFTWEVREHDDFDIYWHDQNQSMINELLAGIQERLSRLQLDVQIPTERKPKVFIYTSSDELKDAVLFEQEWTGALAYPSYNIILSAVNTSILDWAKDALPHEIAHLLVGEAVFGPFGDIPTWLDEGLAEYTSIKMPDYLQSALNTAKNNGTLISISSLSGSFPTSGSGAYLAYAESSSIVAFLIEQYSWEKMRLLLATFKDGATYDNALMSVYSFDVNGLETRWKKYIGAK
jgi:Peptidase MA superfamily